MIDTLVMTLYDNDFLILNHESFCPSTEGLFKEPYYRLGNRGFFKCTQNPTKQDLKKGLYKPRLTVTKRMQGKRFSIALRIEFSAPKLLFGNNFDEVSEADFDDLLEKLHRCLYEMDIFVASDVLRTASLSSIHFCKNIVLTDYSTPSSIMRDIAKIDVNRRLDLNQTDFRNSGHAVKYRSNSFEITFYDKMKDLHRAKTSEKRALEKDNVIQLDLFDKLKTNKPFEVLRMEVRLNSRRKIKQMLDKIDSNEDITFQGLFKKNVSQKILRWYLDEIISQCIFTNETTQKPLEFLSIFKMNNPKAKPRKALQMLGIITALQQSKISDFREVIDLFGKNAWSKLKPELKSYNLGLKSPDNLSKLKTAITDFNTIRLNNFALHNQERLYNIKSTK